MSLIKINDVSSLIDSHRDWLSEDYKFSHDFDDIIKTTLNSLFGDSDGDAALYVFIQNGVYAVPVLCLNKMKVAKSDAEREKIFQNNKFEIPSGYHPLLIEDRMNLALYGELKILRIISNLCLDTPVYLVEKNDYMAEVSINLSFKEAYAEKDWVISWLDSTGVFRLPAKLNRNSKSDQLSTKERNTFLQIVGGMAELLAKQKPAFELGGNPNKSQIIKAIEKLPTRAEESYVSKSSFSDYTAEAIKVFRGEK